MSIIYFRDWFFKQLPGYFKNEDTYKNLDGEGLVERYLRNFGQELDDGIYPYIRDFIDLFDALKCQESLLPHLSFVLGLPPNIDNTAATYRKVLDFAVAVYKIKGTKRSYEVLFNLMGLSIQIIEDPAPSKVLYDLDVPAIYDNPSGPYQYDKTCSYCGTYTIAYNNGNNSSVSQAVLDLAQSIICFLQPINAKLNGFVKRLAIRESFVLNIQEDTNLDQFVIPPGTFSDDFDNLNTFD